MLLDLQRDAGNRAVTALLKEQAQVEPTINAGQGTTDELKAELARLRQEREKFIRGHPGVQGIGGAAATAEEDRIFNKYETLIAKLESRIAERGNSTLPDAKVELWFDGTTLIASGDVSATFAAVSGTPDDSGRFDYSAERQHQENAGPIPEGIYWIAPKQLKNLWYYVGPPASGWGTHRITIHPFDGTKTFGRGGFFVHGGTVPGSIGCIDLTAHMAEFAELIAPYGNSKIKLTVHYPEMGDYPEPSKRTKVG